MRSAAAPPSPAANCSLTADGSWFDGGWQARGWPFHWYYQGDAASTIVPNRSTSNYITHLCNYSVLPLANFNISHYLHNDNIAGNNLVADNITIATGQRSVFTVANVSGGKARPSPNASPKTAGSRPVA